MLQTRLIISRWCARLTECFLNNALFLAWLTSIKTPPNWYAACQSLAMSQKHIRFSDAELCREFKTVLSDVEKFSPSSGPVNRQELEADAETQGNSYFNKVVSKLEIKETPRTPKLPPKSHGRLRKPASTPVKSHALPRAKSTTPLYGPFLGYPFAWGFRVAPL